MISLSDDIQAGIIEAFNSFKICGRPLEYPQSFSTELQLNKTNSIDIEAACLDLHL